MNSSELLQQKCTHQTSGLTDAEVADYLKAVEGWTLQDGKIVKGFRFFNFHRTMAFVNGIAELIHAENHHPELVVSYNRCTVKFNTHSVNDGRGGISSNDFICAAKIDALFQKTYS